MNLDAVDLQIINALQRDARTSFTKIGQELGVPKTTIYTKYRRMKKAGIIKGSTVWINYEKLGFITVNLLVNTKGHENEVIEYINRINMKNGIPFVYKCSGRYNLLVLLMIKEYPRVSFEINRIKQLIRKHPDVFEVKSHQGITAATYYQSINLDHMIKR